ncbi:MSHA biogenesis protein MshJ [Oceanimonas pelagia]|uniref:MSHA biogenesis protein MshJ n=1 Tax=Oceanimonas pelagia TaxID=3028314 RepID=A0AA50KS83_9GAMM|nr:MSHA biogenesis protein MshJ [Oceanimonas pelagia]WMC12303.1 MSHA biogenesis protein MshJ [Oceanimonas pelagia]
MKQRLALLNERFMARPKRERWLLVAAGWALAVWLGLTLFEQTVQASATALQAEQQRLQRELDGQEGLVEEINRRIAELKANDQGPRIARLNRQLSRLNENVDQRMRTLVGPEQMAGLLLSVLDQGSGLTLQGLVNLPAEPMAQGQDGDQRLYRHGLALELSGSYLQLLDYVKRLESLHGRIFWQSLSFELEQYPTGHIRLEFFTISQHKELIRG